MSAEIPDSDQLRTVSLLHALMQMQGSECRSCKKPLCAHELLMSLASGMQEEPRCYGCLSICLGRSRRQLRESLVGYILSRPCYRNGWLWANRVEGLQPAAVPVCLLSPSGKEESIPLEESVSCQQTSQSSRPPDEEWNAGAMGCGELLVKLRGRLNKMHPGQVLKVIALDSGAREDLPAWCRLTGHRLISANHPEYRIQRKEN